MENQSHHHEHGPHCDWINIGLAPAVSMGQLYLVMAWNISQSMNNANQAQLYGYATLQAATTRSVKLLLGG